MSESEKNDFPVMPPPPQREARTVREYFDRIPEESEKTLLDKKHAAQEEEQDALRSYFREMGEMPQLSPQEEFDLWEQIDGNVCQLRHCIYQFAFVYDEHVKLLANPEEDLADIFPPSSRDNVPLPDDPGNDRNGRPESRPSLQRCGPLSPECRRRSSLTSGKKDSKFSIPIPPYSKNSSNGAMWQIGISKITTPAA